MLKSFEEFTELAQRTKSEQFHADKVSVETLHTLLLITVESINKLDQVKKSLFYGKDFDLPQYIKNNFELDKLFPTQNERDIFHGIIGKITEAGELGEALLKSLETGEPLDLINVEEEMGDGFWYDSLILKALGKPMLDVCGKIIRKLAARFGDKFSDIRALNRDLETERKILEE